MEKQSPFSSDDRLKSFNEILHVDEDKRPLLVEFLKENLQKIRPASDLSIANRNYNENSLAQLQDNAALALAFVKKLDPTYDPKKAKMDIWYAPKTLNLISFVKIMLGQHSREEVEEGLKVVENLVKTSNE